jgi:biopolymer transport protein ExbB
MKFCSKLIHLPVISAVALAAVLLFPASAFAQVPSAPATAPPAIAAPVVPSNQNMPAVQVPIMQAPAAPAPNAAPASAEPNAIAAPTTAIALTLPRDLSPWGMFLAADIVVKAVMVGLAFASLLTWTIWFAKAFELLAARRRLHRAIEALNDARSRRCHDPLEW